MTKIIPSLCLGCLAVALMAGCASKSPATAIGKVQMFHLKSVQPEGTRDPLILSETRNRMWGAVTREEREARLGNYYAVHWKTDDPKTPATVTFQYKQARSGSTLHTQSVTVAVPHGSNVTKFEVTGAPYQTGGRVVAWRIAVEQGGRVVGEETSFLWN